jgi:hypothetical protein
MLNKDFFKLSSLSLANNELTGDELKANDVFSYALSTKTLLIRLDLSYKNFRCSFFSHMFNGNPTAGLCFINLIENDSPLHDGVLSSLQRFLNRGQQNQISKSRFDRESNKGTPGYYMPEEKYSTHHHQHVLTMGRLVMKSAQ